MTPEVTKTPKDKKNKDPGIHNLKNDIMIPGGDKSDKQITKTFNQILETEGYNLSEKKPR